MEKLVKTLSMRKPPGMWSQAMHTYDVKVRKEMHKIGSAVRDKLVLDLRKREEHAIAVATVQEMAIPGGCIVNEDTPPSVRDDIRLIEARMVHCHADSTWYGFRGP